MAKCLSRFSEEDDCKDSQLREETRTQDLKTPAQTQTSNELYITWVFGVAKFCRHYRHRL